MRENLHKTIRCIRRSRTRSELVEIVILLALGAVSAVILTVTLVNNI
jgi:hypothetical protein